MDEEGFVPRGRQPSDPRRIIVSSQLARSPSPYGDLRQWEREKDLISLNSSPQSPQLQATGHNVEGSNRGNVHGLQTSTDTSSIRPSLTLETTLIDLDDLSGSHLNVPPQQTVNPPPLIFDRTAARQDSGHQTCEDCEQYGADLLFCNVCDALFCDPCWIRQISHKKKSLAPGSIPHERTDYCTAKVIKAVLENNITPEEQIALHKKDEDTTWFGVIREDGELPLFQDYGRYANIMAENSNPWLSKGRDNRFPSLVSFVGQTGAGKSTIIKLVIDLSRQSGKVFSTPVVGSVRLDLPTSSDVHLYSDPETSKLDTPILYADCEGLDGGERDPLGAKLRKKDKQTKPGRIGSFERKIQRVHHASEREILWADTHAKRGREFAVTHLYPRLLYTFSDVIVFVLKNPRVIESVFEKLVNWAAAALETSSNQPMLPHAIIVLNASENDIDPSLWDTNEATTKLFDSLSRVVSQNATFKKYTLFWQKRGRKIESVQDLLESYYSSVKVVRVPANGRPNLIVAQVKMFYSSIQSACLSARRRRGELRMLLDADELQSYLQSAFDHFARNLDDPFDFVQASFINSPIPLDFGGNILKLAIKFMEAWENKVDGPTIFAELSYMVASCIMLESARSKIRGTAEQIFPQYLEHLDVALERFCDRHWPCEYVKPGGGARCVNVRSGHESKGHQLQNGKVLASGSYISDFCFDAYREKFHLDVYLRFEALLKKLRSRVEDGDELEALAAAAIHKDTVMVYFYHHAARGRTGAFISHSACFSCLFEPPEHALPCGHVLCTSCLRAYGRSRHRTVVELDGCPLESLSRPRSQSWQVLLKAPAAGIRILTLDGGGIRGIVELEILRQLEHALGRKIAIQCFFDLVVGTSTGGIIALGVFAKNWSVEQCTHQFEHFCRKAFTRRAGSNIPGISWFIDNYNHSKYETRPLQEALIDIFSEDEFLFGGLRPYHSCNADIKVAVTATSASGFPVVLANYNRLSQEKLPYQFQRPESSAVELKIWEAARATSAAPRIFKPLFHRPSKQVYLDGAIYHNNPINIADKERKLIWPSLENYHPDIVLSIGTSMNATGRSTVEKEPSPLSGILSHGRSLYKIAIDHIVSNLDSEKAWENYLSVLQPPPDYRSRYVRLNPRIGEDPPKIDEVDRLKYIQDTVRKELSVDRRIDKIASQLIASSFYFEIDKIMKGSDDDVHCQGHVYCRLLPESREISQFGRLIRDKVQVGYTPSLVIQEKHRGQHAKSVTITSDVIERMIRRSVFSMHRIEVKLSNSLALTEIFLCLAEEEMHPISGFPRSLLQDEISQAETRHNLSVHSGRGLARTPSQHLQRKRWVPPSPSRANHAADIISRYSADDYFLGGSSQDALQRTANRFGNGSGRHPDISELPAQSNRPEATTGLNTSGPLNSDLKELEGDFARYI